ncbi:hypothetical protein ACNQKP_06915 [Bdellovibrio bacteriovorus]|uniref:hypothetical protein n=1 Tax=Bdellovibrio bacteriovorus TaxID=959 RepID=UPI003AA7AB79
MTYVDLSNTLLIIGAGAHVPYDMPSGHALRAEIKKLYTYNDYINFSIQPRDEVGKLKWNILKTAMSLNVLSTAERNSNKKVFDTGLSETHYKQYFELFLKSFSESHVLSIDTYLSNVQKEEDEFIREVFKLFGKLTIACVIQAFESSSPLGGRRDDWIHHFINSFVRKSPNDLFKFFPKIITFNYDRIFERMLFTHLTEFHKFSHLKAKTEIEQLNILHVYGSLGDYVEWQEITELPNFFESAIANIKVIGEDRSDMKQVEDEIREKYKRANRIYFLGYGFDEDNNRLLRTSFGFDDWEINKEIYSTSIGIRKSDLSRIKKTLNTTKMISRLPDRTMREVSCSDLLFEQAPLI